MADDDDGPMQSPRTTRDVVKSAPPAPAAGSQAPDASEADTATEAATGAVRVDQEDA